MTTWMLAQALCPWRPENLVHCCLRPHLTTTLNDAVLQVTVESSADLVSALEQVGQLVPSQVLYYILTWWSRM